MTTSNGTATTVYIGNIEDDTTGPGSTCLQVCSPNRTTTTYYYAGTVRIASATNGTLSYLGSDLLASATVAVGSDGTPQAATLYAPYGTTRYTSGVMPGSYGYTGQHDDTSVTGLDYYGARYYDPVVGQFVSADTVLPSNGADPWGLDRYAYVAGNPETHVDADGHCWPLCTMIIGAVIGAAAGAATSVVSQAVSGQSIDWGEVGKQAAVGAVAGAVSGLVGPEAGPLVRAAVDTGAAVAGQVVSNALDGKPLGDGVLMAAAVGAASSIGMGAVAEAGGALLGRAAGKAAEALEESGAAGVGVDAALECVGADESIATATGVARPGSVIGAVGFPTYEHFAYKDIFWKNVGIRGGVAPARAYIPELLEPVLRGQINPGCVFDLRTTLDNIPEAYAAMDERRAIKSLLRVSALA